MTIVEFLTARLDEESCFWANPSAMRFGGVGLSDLILRMRAEVLAKRAIVERLSREKHEVVEGDCWFTCAAATEARDGGETCNDIRRGQECDCGRDARVEGYLRLLAQPYADREGYDEEWRP